MKQEIYLFGRDAEPSSIDGIHATLDWLEAQMTREQRWAEEIKHYTYSNEYVKLIAEGIVSGDMERRMTKRDLACVANLIEWLYFHNGFGPRELAVHFLVQGERDWWEIGKMFIFFTDLESTERVSEKVFE